MPYYKLLNNIISNTDYTQEQIAQKCTEQGTKVNRTYINKLLNNKLPAPTTEISKAIANVCNVDERLLIIEGYIDKAPKEIKQAFISLKNIIMLYSLNIVENKIDEKALNGLKEEIAAQPLADFIIELIDNGDAQIDIKEKGFELEAKEDNLIFNLTQPTAFKITDNAMCPMIKENDEVILEIKDKYTDGDIVIVKFNNEENITARQVVFLGNDIKLFALNNKYKSKLIHKNDIKILGKVKKVISEI